MNKLMMRAVAAAALVVVPPLSFATDLMDAYTQAQANDPTIRAAGHAVAAGREKAVQGDALWKPQVALSASVAYLNDKSSTSLPPALTEVIKPESSGVVHQAAVQLQQPIYNQKSTADRKQMREQTGLAEVTYRNAGQDLMQRVGEAYFNLLLAEEALRVAQAEKAAVRMQRDRAQARFDVGRGKITELQETQARYDGVLAREISSESTLANRRAQYRELTGAEAQALATLAPRLAATAPEPDNLAAWQQRGLDGNTRVAIKRGEVAIAGAEISKYTLSARPTLDLVASYTLKGQNGSLSPVIAPNSNRSAMLGFQLNVPLSTGGALSSRERESIAKKAQADQELAEAERDMRLKVQDGFLSVKSGAARVQALAQSVQSSRTALEATTLGRDVGTRTELDVLDAQQRLFSSELDLAQAKNDYLLGRLRLASAAGDLQEHVLQDLNALLIPASAMNTTTATTSVASWQPGKGEQK